MSESLNTNELVGYDWRMYTYYDYVATNVHNHTESNLHGFVALGQNSRVGYQNPRWKDQCRHGANATTPLVAVEYSGDTDRSPWSYSFDCTQFNSHTGALSIHAVQNGSGFPDLSVGTLAITAPSNVISDVHNRCIRKFINEVIAAQSSENLTGRSIKHFKHDMHSLVHPMQGIQNKINDYLTSLKKVSYGKLKGPSLLSTIGSAYLEFKFGVAPFVDDVTAIMTDMCIKDRKRNPSVPVEATASQTFSGSSYLSSISGTGAPITPYSNISQTSRYSERMRGAVRTGINDDGRLGFVQDNRLLPKDWAPTAFSILPYAWMVNYFTNIGDIIEAASFRFSDVVWGCATTRTTNEISLSDFSFNGVQWFNPGPGIGVTNNQESFGGNATFSYKKVTRSILTPADLIPSFAFSIPTGPTPWLNMMAAFLPRITSVVKSLFT